jgi:hypothetical protein
MFRAAAGTACLANVLGDPPKPERCALTEFLARPPPRPRGLIPVCPDSDGAAILRRVLAEGATEAERRRERRRAQCSARKQAAQSPEQAAAIREYERSRKRRWRIARRAAGLPTDDAAAQRARRAIAPSIW